MTRASGLGERRVTSDESGSVLVLSIFVIAMMSALVIGILQVNMSEIWLTQHRAYSAQAKAVAEAGLNDALSEIRDDRTWSTGFDAKPLAGGEGFGGGQYTVDVNGTDITSTGSIDAWVGYSARLEAEITVSDGNAPYIVRIDSMAVNQ